MSPRAVGGVPPGAPRPRPRGLRALVLADEAPVPDAAALIYHQQPDLVLYLGDLRPDDLEPLGRWQGPKLGVHGNHDADDDLFRALHIEDLHGRSVEVCGLRFGGLEGCPRYDRTAPFQHTDRQADRALRRMGEVDVLLAHAPPEGVNDDPGDRVHGGWPSLRAYVERRPPRMLLHGHTYPAVPVEAVGTTAVRYVRGWRLVELPPAPERRPVELPPAAALTDRAGRPGPGRSDP